MRRLRGPLRPLRPLRLSAILCLLAHCGGSDGPTAPTASAGESIDSFGLASGPSRLADAAIRGRVLDSLTGAPVRGAHVEAASMFAVDSDGDGSFSLSTSGTGVVSLVARADGYFAHETHARTGSPSPIEIELIPQGSRFDLDFYDHVFRHLGQDGTHIWDVEPTYEVLTQVFDCVDHQISDACDVFEATDEQAPGQFVSLARQVVAGDASRYTGGAVLGSEVVEVAVAPGTRITRSQAWVQNRVRILIARLPDDYSWTTWWYYRDTPSLYSALVVINKAHKALRGVYSHELAHTLGYDHPNGGDQVPIPSIMRYGHGPDPDSNDILHGAILYRRPAGSRTPDQDPNDFVANASREIPTGPGELIEMTAR
jgi:Carboxypeptidase regulatory-like domain